MDPTPIRFKFDYLSCGIDKKPKWALVVPALDEKEGIIFDGEGSCWGIHSYYLVKEQAEMVQTALSYSLLRPVSYTDRGEPIVSMPVTKGK